MGAFGHLTRVYGQYSYALSPFEQKAFKGFGKGLYNVWKRYVVESWYFYVPQGVIAYGIYDWANKDYDRRCRKEFKATEK